MFSMFYNIPYPQCIWPWANLNVILNCYSQKDTSYFYFCATWLVPLLWNNSPRQNTISSVGTFCNTGIINMIYTLKAVNKVQLNSGQQKCLVCLNLLIKVSKVKQILLSTIMVHVSLYSLRWHNGIKFPSKYWHLLENQIVKIFNMIFSFLLWLAYWNVKNVLL